MSDGNNDYKVGYGNPPKSNQFKKGISGNPTMNCFEKRKPKSPSTRVDAAVAFRNM